eukprot:2938477-Pyramimonas_sp.AAC.2
MASTVVRLLHQSIGACILSDCLLEAFARFLLSAGLLQRGGRTVEVGSPVKKGAGFFWSVLCATPNM